MLITSRKFIATLILAALIMSSGSLLFVGWPIPLYLGAVLLIFFAFRVGIHINRKAISKLPMFILVLLVLFSLNYVFTKSRNIGNYITVLSYLGLAKLSLMVLNSDREQFFEILFRVLVFILSHSLIGWVLIQFIEAKELMLGKSGWEVWSVANMFFFDSSINVLGLEIIRNQGVFWEPGILGIYSNILLFISLYIKTSQRTSWLASMVILTTFSSTSIFILVAQLMFLAFKRKSSFSGRFKSLIVFFILLVILGSNLREKQDAADEKVISSLSMRTFDIYAGALIAWRNPVFGIGLNKSEYVEEAAKILPFRLRTVAREIGDRGNTSGIMKLMYSFGLFTGSVILFSFFLQRCIPHNGHILTFVLLIGLLSEPLLMTPFFMLFILSGFENLKI